MRFFILLVAVCSCQYQYDDASAEFIQNDLGIKRVSSIYIMILFQFANIILGEIVLNILNATTIFDDKYTEVVNKIQYIESCATGFILLQIANYFTQFLYFVLTTIQTMNLGRKPKPNRKPKPSTRPTGKKTRQIQEEIDYVDNGAHETWL